MKEMFQNTVLDQSITLMLDLGKQASISTQASKISKPSKVQLFLK